MSLLASQSVEYIIFSLNVGFQVLFLNIYDQSPVVSINMICISTSHTALSASDVNHSVY